jgi:hypothetical protein
MIKKSLRLILILGVLFSLSAFQTNNPAECDVEEALKTCKKNLSPFSFQDRKTVTFDYEDAEQVKEYSIQLFDGEEYRFVLNRAYAPGVEFEVYNKSKDHSKRKLIYSSKEDSNKGTLLTFEPVTIPNVYVDVIVPGGVSNRDQGCITMMIGYELVFID